VCKRMMGSAGLSRKIETFCTPGHLAFVRSVF
jgi:hypothetical protein